MRSRLAVAVPLVPLLLFAVAAGGPAAPPQTNLIVGTFVLDAGASDDVAAAIQKATSHMSFITRPIARGRLKKTNLPYHRLVFSPSPSAYELRIDDRKPIVTPADGSAAKWTREDGEVLGVSTKPRGGALEQRFVADDGQRVNVYTLSPDGQSLSMDVTVTSPRLPQPVTYRLVYRRQG
ncbi:MAG TPA: hypothetical protein VFQ38_20425 [Longimicrobiales bacterium]|nr:hypothetical protein [Longimicrobiales bacterium]